MSNVIRLQSINGIPVEFIDEIIATGAMKDVYFSPDKSYVVAFFRNSIDNKSMERLKNIIGPYRKRVFKKYDRDLDNLFCWPTDLVIWNDKTGVVCPAYQEHFYFNSGKFKGKEKEGKWFASAKLRNRFLEPGEKGNWRSYFQICIQIAHAVRCLHSAALAHSDLSYKNVLVDPQSGTAVMIDIDGLIVPGKFHPDVVGTPDFIAPEVVETRSLKVGDIRKRLPGFKADRHALAVLIYMYLLYRHPLRGGKVHDLDPVKDESLSMGANALFIEHPTDLSNRPNIEHLTNAELPQSDVTKLPYTICGPYLKHLFDRAFIDGLHNPSLRPSATEWEEALVKTMSLLRHCQNQDCEAKWFVLTDDTKDPHCPFCGHPYRKWSTFDFTTSLFTLPIKFIKWMFVPSASNNADIDVSDGIKYPGSKYVKGKAGRDGHRLDMVAASRQSSSRVHEENPRNDNYRLDMVAASRQSSSRVHEETPQNDNFVLHHCPKSDWYIIAVADGTASAEFSRKGSEIACKAAVAFCEDKLKNPYNDFDAYLKDFINDTEKNKNKLLPKAYEILVYAAYNAHNAIKREANSKNKSLDSFATTLLLTICKKLNNYSYIILSFTIGSGAIGIIYRDKFNQRVCLNFNFSKEKNIRDKEFITMPELFKNSVDLINRICVKKKNNITSLLMMTAGISDEKLKDNNLYTGKKWIDLWTDISIHVPHYYNKYSAKGLLDWIDFKSSCNYDDRTIAILYSNE